jgi:hypothetical protein
VAASHQPPVEARRDQPAPPPPGGGGPPVFAACCVASAGPDQMPGDAYSRCICGIWQGGGGGAGRCMHCQWCKSGALFLRWWWRCLGKGSWGVFVLFFCCMLCDLTHVSCMPGYLHSVQGLRQLAAACGSLPFDSSEHMQLPLAWCIAGCEVAGHSFGGDGGRGSWGMFFLCLLHAVQHDPRITHAWLSAQLAARTEHRQVRASPVVQ